MGQLGFNSQASDPLCVQAPVVFFTQVSYTRRSPQAEFVSVQWLLGRLHPKPSSWWFSVAFPSCSGSHRSCAVPSAAPQICSGFLSFPTSFSLPLSLPTAEVIPPPLILHPSLSTTHLLPSARSSFGCRGRYLLPVRLVRLPVDLGRHHWVLVSSNST